MGVETIARRYASALADVVMQTGEAFPVQNELKQWETLLFSNRELFNAFNNPAIAHNSKERLLEDLISRSNPSGTTANFLRVLLRNSRLTGLQEINDRFEEVIDERRGVTSASVTSSRELTESEKAELKANLQKMSGKEVNLQFYIDENVIGGAVTRLGSTVYDGSVKTQLELLKQQMIDS
ncbi:MAG: ATP synthase F1 subunit delta [Acidobacteria bacterium]|nr:MAG: ATP synthase F1 subunit delta [Acidobacteriota bacterium]REJ99199.1 MAG: ATP synthase F1 subunit delta [Acidobacteriota bacterium]REK16080.1 MAG: ATP synthase F1 subunit delta [Acidobacteriota bacterium]REK43761.1 MAG: ATP synthase F1 subunit delta [Acidobacteriota bacterium]